MRHPAKAVLDDFAKWNPGIWKAVEKIRQRLPSGPHSLPIEQIYQIAIPSQDNATLMALAHWEPTRGIYRFDENLYADLIASPGERVSVDALMQMPEPCIFVETPRLPVSCNGYEHAAVGAWVFVGRMKTDDARFLQLTFLNEVYDEGGGLLTYPMLTTRMLLPPRGLLSVRGALQDTVRQAIAAELATDDDHDRLQHLGQPIVLFWRSSCIFVVSPTLRKMAERPAFPIDEPSRFDDWVLCVRGQQCGRSALGLAQISRQLAHGMSSRLMTSKTPAGLCDHTSGAVICTHFTSARERPPTEPKFRRLHGLLRCDGSTT